MAVEGAWPGRSSELAVPDNKQELTSRELSKMGLKILDKIMLVLSISFSWSLIDNLFGIGYYLYLL